MLDKIISAAIDAGHYVNVHNAMNGYQSSHNYSITFDSNLCSKMLGWKGIVCSGNISLYPFPDGYMPDLCIDGDAYHCMMHRNDNIRMMLVVADSKDLFDAWKWYQMHKDDKDPNPLVRDIYSWSMNYDHWYVSGKYRSTTIGSVVGLEHEYVDIMHDIDILLNKRDIINSLDMTPSCNYLLESRPGMGKTSLIRAICTTLNVPMYTVTATAMARTDPSILLASPGDTRISVILFEDFDRYLATSKEEQMASILNTMDGVTDMPVTVRFFTTNSSIGGQKLEAFMSRMRRHIILERHCIHAYKHSIDIIFPSMDDKDKKHVMDLFFGASLTMRVANQILCASMVYKYPLEYIKDTVRNIHLITPSRTMSVKCDDD